MFAVITIQKTHREAKISEYMWHSPCHANRDLKVFVATLAPHYFVEGLVFAWFGFYCGRWRFTVACLHLHYLRNTLNGRCFWVSVHTIARDWKFPAILRCACGLFYTVASYRVKVMVFFPLPWLALALVDCVTCIVCPPSSLSLHKSEGLASSYVGCSVIVPSWLPCLYFQVKNDRCCVWGFNLPTSWPRFPQFR